MAPPTQRWGISLFLIIRRMLDSLNCILSATWLTLSHTGSEVVLLSLIFCSLFDELVNVFQVYQPMLARPPELGGG